MSTRITIQHIRGSKANQVEYFEIDNTSELTIGRDQSSALAFDAQKDVCVSRKHAVISWTNPNPKRFTIRDLNSSNGTKLNGQPVTGDVELAPGDTIELGADTGFVFDLQPRPAEFLKRTRLVGVSDAASGQATRVIDPARASRDTRSQLPEPPPSAPAKSSVGRETVQRLLTEVRKSSNRVWMYTLAALLVVIACGGGVLYYLHQRNATEMKNEVGAIANAPKPLTAQDIVQAYRNATVYITVKWQVYDSASGKPIYIKTQMYEGASVPCFVRLEDETIVPWLTTDDDNHRNIGVSVTGVQGSGFVISPNGYIITSKHVTSGYSVPLGNFLGALSGTALVYDLQTRPRFPRFEAIDLGQNKAAKESLTSWTPSSGGALFAPRLPILVSDLKAPFQGRTETLEVKFPGSRNGIAARLVRTSTDADVAELKIDTDQQLKTTTLSSEDDAKMGSKVVVLGFPSFSTATVAITRSVEGGQVKENIEVVPEPTVTEGVITQRSKGIMTEGGVTTVSIGDVYQLSVPTAQGNSGGPVFDDSGNVIGIFTYGSQRETVTFAVPIKYARELFQLQREN